MSKKVGLLLSGCGVFDGSEIHETVLALLFLDQAGVETVCMAPDVDFQVIDHVSQKPTGEKRNVLTESARISRGDIRDIHEVSADDLDALIIPGGFGAAKNLCDFAEKGADATVHPEVSRLLREMRRANKPLGAICIAPAALVKALADEAPVVTIGNDVGTAAAIEKAGGKHVNRTVDDICVDEKHKIVTTPAYMLGPGIGDVASGIEKLVKQVVAML